MSAATELFVRNVVATEPELQPLFEEHMEDNFGEMLPHMFFGDVTRWFESELSDDASRPKAVRLLRYLESIYDAAPADVKNVIDVSFVENLTVNGAGVGLLGPQLQEAARELGVLYPTDDDPTGSPPHAG
jgi:hypothetical protein